MTVTNYSGSRFDTFLTPLPAVFTALLWRAAIVKVPKVEVIAMPEPMPTAAAVPLSGARPTAGAVVAAEAQWPPARRLVVLVPPTIKDETLLAAKLYAAAEARRVNVLFLGLATRPEDEPGLRRRLALLAACTRDNHAVRADYRLAVGEDWLGWLKLAWQPGDLVLCHAEQQLGWGRGAPALAHVLADKVGLTVVELAGYCEAEADPAAQSLHNVFFWLGTVLIIAGFFWLQATIQHDASGAAQTGLLAASVLAEFVLLAAWVKRME
jgi:hypothetical protein